MKYPTPMKSSERFIDALIHGAIGVFLLIAALCFLFHALGVEF